MRHVLISALLLFLQMLPVQGDDGCGILTLSGEGWSACVNSGNGTLGKFIRDAQGGSMSVPFRSGPHSGPAFDGVVLHLSGDDPLTFSGLKDGISYSIEYRACRDHLCLVCTVRNDGQTPYRPERIRFRFGVDSEMRTFPEWDGKFFPTLIRCEKDFAWGYFMSPAGSIFAFGVEDPVASYGLNYIFEGNMAWLWGHQIYTASLDFIHCLPLPARHPSHLTEILPGEQRSWTVRMGIADSLKQVKSLIAGWISAPLAEAGRYTLCKGDRARIKVYGDPEKIRAVAYCPDGKRYSVRCADSGQESGPGSKECVLTTSPLYDAGQYRLEISDGNRHSEVMLHVRQPWSWYLKKARDFVAENPPFFSASCETFYGYYPAFLAARHFPDGNKDSELQLRFRNGLSQMTGPDGKPREQANPKRIQNFSALAGMLVDLWEATGESCWLETASGIGDFLESVQWPDGSYRSDSIHYTAVIYPAKSMFELADAEFRAGWKERARRHYLSAVRAAEDLRMRLDDIETEGDMTFEDGMITCSALQMALCGLYAEDPSVRGSYAEAAASMMDKHLCLEQRLVPDCRMRGATLRYWEALDIYFTPNQAMNSPHGWTAWKIYALCYLYLLTGEEHYLDEMTETLGTSVQLMAADGYLRWGFIPDPYVRGLVSEPVPGKPDERRVRETVIGEQYMEMISPWFRPEDGQAFTNFGGPGGAGDNTVYEIFKALEECMLTVGYVIVTDKGEVRCHNCSARWTSPGRLCIEPEESCVTRIHVNAKIPLKVKVRLKGRTERESLEPGMTWVGDSPYRLPAAG